MSNEQNQSEAKAHPVDMLVMVPIRDDESGHCSPQCPYLRKWEHPFWHHTAWCWKQMRDLNFYDYWLADCINNEPDKALSNIRNCGNTKAP